MRGVRNTVQGGAQGKGCAVREEHGRGVQCRGVSGEGVCGTRGAEERGMGKENMGEHRERRHSVGVAQTKGHKAQRKGSIGRGCPVQGGSPRRSTWCWGKHREGTHSTEGAQRRVVHDAGVFGKGVHCAPLPHAPPCTE